MQQASLFLMAIIVPRIDTAIGSLKIDLFISSIVCPGVKPCSIILLLDGWEESISEIIPLSPKFNSEAVLICYSQLTNY